MNLFKVTKTTQGFRHGSLEGFVVLRQKKQTFRACIHFGFYLLASSFFGCIKTGATSEKSAAKNSPEQSENSSIDQKVFNENCLSPDTRHLFSNSSNGLGNKLLAMAGSYTFAKLSHRCWLHVWSVNAASPASFHELFQNKINAVTSEGRTLSPVSWDFDPKNKKRILGVFEKGPKAHDEVFGGNSKMHLNNSAQSVFINAVTLPLIKELNSAEQIKSSTLFLRSLVPVHSVSEKVQQILKPLDGAPFVGVHLRG
jgi:hypothetical protein